MTQSHISGIEPGHDLPQDRMSALFANLIIQQTNLALMLLGRVPNPETGERVQDLDSARLLIDQLEMLEVKTKGNLDKREEQLLKQSLMTLRLAFVEAADAAPAEPPAAPQSAPRPPAPEAAAGATPQTDAGAPEEEHRKKFSKKY